MLTEELLNKLDPVVQHYTTGDYYAEVFKAKEEFFERTGTVYDDDKDFDQRMNLFMDWYLFDRDLPGVDLPPIRNYLRLPNKELNEDLRRIYQDFSQSIHSLFLVKRITWIKKNIVVEDLFSNKTYEVRDPKLNQAFNSGDIIEARLIHHHGEFHFAQGFCFHPVEMKSFILGEIKKIRNQDPSRHLRFILQLAKMKLKHQRYSHIDVRHIYTFDSKF